MTNNGYGGQSRYERRRRRDTATNAKPVSSKADPAATRGCVAEEPVKGRSRTAVLPRT